MKSLITWLECYLIFAALLSSGCSGVNSFQKDGELQLAGLEAPVTVMRDDKGMAYIYAQSGHDATMAQGFVTAQDRLFQMELLRLLSCGRMSELAGDAAKHLDIRSRTIGFYRNADLGWELVLDWVLINGGLAALGALLAAAHPLTVIGAFVAAPLTSLNPTIGAGMVTGAIELFLRKPEVGDFHKLRSDTTHFKGWWKNRVTRVLLVFLFSTLGSAIGTYVAGFRIFDKLT